MAKVNNSLDSHIAVLLNQAIDGLNIQASGHYIDGTFGRGGHSAEIEKKLDQAGKLFVFDKDPRAIATAKEKYLLNKKVVITPGSYTQMSQVMTDTNLIGKVDGILLDLGVSSPQLDNADRGFSFMKSGSLDMRMDNSIGQNAGESAGQWLTKVAERELADVLKVYGEERYAKRIAKAIIIARNEKELTDTRQLAEIIKQAHPNWKKGKHPATQSFQAIRIYINNELIELKQVLTQVLDILKPGGRIAIISFHSLEDRIVKKFFSDMTKGLRNGQQLPDDLPIMESQIDRKLKLVGKAIKASQQEVDSNPRSRSAVLRVAEKL